MPRTPIYNDVTATIHSKLTGGELTVEQAKQLIGWEEEPEGKDWGDKYFLKDAYGKKVRLNNNTTNRPYRKGVAIRYAKEHLRRKWQLNGETLIFDRYGIAQNGQHRLVGFVLASQMLEQDKETWGDYGKTALTMPCIVVTGISEKRDVADSQDLGLKRSLGDVIFRNKEFKDNAEAQKKLSSILSVALRLVWLRAGGKTVSDAPHFPHSEALDFQDAHPRIQDAVEYIYALDSTDDETGRISKAVSLGYAAALMYLMGTMKTDTEAKKFSINDATWPKAEKFWKTFASGVSKGEGDVFHALRTRLSNVSSTSSSGRDEVCGTIIKAFQHFLEHGDNGSGIKSKDLTLKRGKNDNGKIVLKEFPRLGGIDTEVIPVVAEEAAEEPQDETQAEPELAAAE